MRRTAARGAPRSCGATARDQGGKPVEVVRSSLDERAGVRVRRYRLALADGTVLDVGRDEPDGDWRIEREIV